MSVYYSTFHLTLYWQGLLAYSINSVIRGRMGGGGSEGRGAQLNKMISHMNTFKPQKNTNPWSPPLPPPYTVCLSKLLHASQPDYVWKLQKKKKSMTTRINIVIAEI